MKPILSAAIVPPVVIDGVSDWTRYHDQGDSLLCGRALMQSPQPHPTCNMPSLSHPHHCHHNMVDVQELKKVPGGRAIVKKKKLKFWGPKVDFNWLKKS